MTSCPLWTNTWLFRTRRRRWSGSATRRCGTRRGTSRFLPRTASCWPVETAREICPTLPRSPPCGRTQRMVSHVQPRSLLPASSQHSFDENSLQGILKFWWWNYWEGGKVRFIVSREVMWFATFLPDQTPYSRKTVLFCPILRFYNCWSLSDICYFRRDDDVLDLVLSAGAHRHRAARGGLHWRGVRQQAQGPHLRRLHWRQMLRHDL